MNKLLIIESPNKIHTISKYLKDDDFKIIATIGHIRDLPTNSLGFDEKSLEPKWIIPSTKNDSQSKKKIVASIKEAASKADIIYLATDPDREGEAISWHVYSILPEKDKAKCKRITFNEITKSAINEALEHPRELDEKWIESQFARRILDRLVGYKLSKQVKNKIGGRSAGRVQSVALKMIYDRENEIKKFKPKDWWTLDPISKKFGKLILRKINSNIANLNVEQLNDDQDGTGVNFDDFASAEKVKNNLTDKFKIYKIDKPKRYRSNPKEPYKTSTLQQDGINRLKWSVSQVTFVAQKLYEGVKLGNEYVALISYPRTDSIRISPYFTELAKKYITQTFGAKYFELHKFTSAKGKTNVQDAHEAIRVIDPFITPESIKNKVQKDEYELYNLIWRRTIASFMCAAEYENTVVRIINNGNKFYTYSRILVAPGYKKIYQDDSEVLLRDLKLTDELLGQIVEVNKIEIKKHTTEPPARYNQASLIKELDNAGVGRPSTYRSMANMALDRGYAELVSHSYHMLPLGNDVVAFLIKYFNFVLNKEFTRKIEDKLDDIANNEIDWKEPIREFQPILNNSLQKATQAQQKEDFVGRKCPNCGGELIYRYTKSKGMRFIGCSNFPKCKYNEFPNQPQPKPTGLKCPDCGGDLIIKISKKKRKFIGCNNYPKCNFIMKTTPVIMKTIDKAMAQGAVPDVTVERAVIKAKTTENKEK